MRVFQVSFPVNGLIFDMDNTLYSNPAYAQHQEDALVERLAQSLGWEPRVCQERVNEWRKDYAQRHEGRKPSLGNTFVGFGIPIETSVEWRREVLQPEQYLEPNPYLAGIMANLAANFRLSVVTNNPVEIARRTLAIIGLAEMIPVIIGLDSTNVSKPDPQAFGLAAASMGLPTQEIVSIGDRFEVDIEPAIGLGMGGILVAGVEDVYQLPNFFATKNNM